MKRLSLIAILLSAACGDDDQLPIFDAGPQPDSATRDAGPAMDAGGDDAGPMGSDAATTDAGPPALEPQIPELNGECPDFTQDTVRVLGLDVEILAGTPGDTPGPLLIGWHGTGGSGSQVMRSIPDSIKDDIVAQGGLIVAPSDDGSAREGGTANGVWYERSDLATADQLVACAVRDHNIDPARIHVTGCSAGGIMGAVMTVVRSSYVASSLLDSGGLLREYEFEEPNHIPAVMTMHGGEGDVVIVPFQFLAMTLDDLIVESGGFAIDCNHEMGHCRSPAILKEAGWNFLEAHPFGTPSPYSEPLPSTFPTYCTIWP